MHCVHGVRRALSTENLDENCYLSIRGSRGSHSGIADYVTQQPIPKIEATLANR